MGDLPHPLLLSTVLHMDTVGGVDFKYVFFAWVGLLILLLLGLYVRKNVKTIPGKVQSVFELMISFLGTNVTNMMGDKGKKYIPILVAVFVYVFVMNLLGLVPGFDAPTANLNTTAAIAICVFIYYNYLGIKQWGGHYISHFTGPVKALTFLMLPLEIISHISRPLSMALRLFGNIFGEETTLLIFFSFGASIFVGVLVGTVPLYFLFLLAKTLQAFILFTLASVYIQGAIEPAH